jgi:hypothetical protein
MAFAAAAVSAWLAVLAARPAWIVPTTLFLATAALPAIVPQLSLGRFQIYLFEPFLCASVFVASGMASRLSPRAVYGSAAMLGLAAWLAYQGVVHGHDNRWIMYDIRGLVLTALAFVVAALAAERPDLVKSCTSALQVSLWWSAAVSLLASTVGLEIAGRRIAASLVNPDALDGRSVRVLSPATHLGLAVVCGCVALLITGRIATRRAAPFLVPSLIIVVLSFSRNSIIALAVATVGAVIAGRGGIRLTMIVARSAIAATVVAAVLSLAFVGAGTVPGAKYVREQATSYGERVLAGLAPDVRDKDPSAQLRVRENRYLISAFGLQPVRGHGAGYAYQPPTGLPGTFGQQHGRYYAHNFWLWLLVKGGLFGLAVFAFFAIWPTLAALWSRPEGLQMAPVVAAVSLLAICIVAPLPIGAGESAVTFGAVLGLACGLRYRRAPSGGPQWGGTLTAPLTSHVTAR